MLSSSDNSVSIHQTEAPTGRGGCTGRTAVAIGLFAVAMVVIVLLVADGDSADDGRASALVLAPEELVETTGGSPTDYRRSSSPIDISTAERAARTATGGRVPSPSSRHLSTVRHTTTGHEVTQAAIVYDDPSDAENLAEAASPLLASTFGLMYEQIDIPSADEALSWSNSRYRAVTIRRDGTIVLIGTTDVGALDHLTEWARQINDKAGEMAAERATESAAEEAAATSPEGAP